ncbi:MAG: hypothetical protein LBT08_07065 [Synergistaceae bacterium]|nr:hypothetical protein [Synergistaceae bacterium]
MADSHKRRGVGRMLLEEMMEKRDGIAILHHHR